MVSGSAKIVCFYKAGSLLELHVAGLAADILLFVEHSVEHRALATMLSLCLPDSGAVSGDCNAVAPREECVRVGASPKHPP